MNIGLNKRIVLHRCDFFATHSYLPFVLVAPTAGENVVQAGCMDAARLGVLMSSVAAAWIRCQLRAGVSIENVLGHFPYPNATDRTMMPILATSGEIENVRGDLTAVQAANLYLGGELPEELIKAHFKNDRNVRRAYGVSPDASDEACLAVMNNARISDGRSAD